jgi:hypothetical protein
MMTCGVLLQDFKSDLQQGQEMVQRCATLGEHVCQSTAPRGQEVIRREVQSLRDDWANFSTAVEEVGCCLVELDTARLY